MLHVEVAAAKVGVDLRLGRADGLPQHAHRVDEDAAHEGVVEPGRGDEVAEGRLAEMGDAAVQGPVARGAVGPHGPHDELLAQRRSALLLEAPPGKRAGATAEGHDDGQAPRVVELRGRVRHNFPRLSGGVAKVVEPPGAPLQIDGQGVLEAGVERVVHPLVVLKGVRPRVHGARVPGGIRHRVRRDFPPPVRPALQVLLLLLVGTPREEEHALLPPLQGRRLVGLKFFDEELALRHGPHRDAPHSEQLGPVVGPVALHRKPAVRGGVAERGDAPLRVERVDRAVADRVLGVGKDSEKLGGRGPRLRRPHEAPDGDGGGPPVVELVEDVLHEGHLHLVAVVRPAVVGQLLSGREQRLGREEEVVGRVGVGIRPVARRVRLDGDGRLVAVRPHGPVRRRGR